MRLVLDTDPHVLTVRRYASHEVDVGGQVLQAPFLVSASRLITDWPVSSAAALDLDALEPALALKPNILIIGDDARPTSALRRAVEARGVAFEVMDLGAACRTYNVLVQERREVVAGLFPKGSP